MHPSLKYRGYVLHSFEGVFIASPINVEEEGGAEFTSAYLDGLRRMIDELLDSDTDPDWYADWEERGGAGLIHDPIRPVPQVYYARPTAVFRSVVQDNSPRVFRSESATVLNFTRGSAAATLNFSLRSAAPVEASPVIPERNRVDFSRLSGPRFRSTRDIRFKAVRDNHVAFRRIITKRAIRSTLPVALVGGTVALTPVTGGLAVPILASLVASTGLMIAAKEVFEFSDDLKQLNQTARMAGHFLAAGAAGATFAMKALPFAGAALVPLAA